MLAKLLLWRKGGESTGGGEGAERANCSLKPELWNFWLPLLTLSVITQTNAIIQSLICLVLVILLLVHKTLNGPGPKYLPGVLLRNEASRPLRSSRTGPLVVPRTGAKTGRGSF